MKIQLNSMHVIITCTLALYLALGVWILQCAYKGAINSELEGKETTVELRKDDGIRLEIKKPASQDRLQPTISPEPVSTPQPETTDTNEGQDGNRNETEPGRKTPGRANQIHQEDAAKLASVGGRRPDQSGA